MKVVLSNSNITTGACSCKLASTHTYCVDSNYKEPSIDLKTNTKSKKKKKLDKIRNQHNKNITEKLDSDNFNEKSKKREYRSENNTKKEKKDKENKRYEYGKKTRNIENDVPTEKQKLCIF